MSDHMTPSEVADSWVSTILNVDESEISRLEAFEGLLASDPTRAIGLVARLNGQDQPPELLSRLTFLLVNLSNAGFLDSANALRWSKTLRTLFDNSIETGGDSCVIEYGHPLSTADLANAMRTDPTLARNLLRNACESDTEIEEVQKFAAAALARLFLCRASSQGDEANMTEIAYGVFFEIVDGPNRYAR